MSATKTKPKPPLFDFEDLGLRAVDADPEAITLLRWAKSRRTEDAAEHRALVKRLILACNELHASQVPGEHLDSATLSALRYRFCERTLGLGFRLATCNVLPLPELARCLEACRSELRQGEERENLASLEKTAPRERVAA